MLVEEVLGLLCAVYSSMKGGLLAVYRRLNEQYGEEGMCVSSYDSSSSSSQQPLQPCKSAPYTMSAPTRSRGSIIGKAAFYTTLFYASASHAHPPGAELLPFRDIGSEGFYSDVLEMERANPISL